MRYLYLKEKFMPRNDDKEITANHFFYLDSLVYFKKLSDETTKQNHGKTALVAVYGPPPMAGGSDARWLYEEVLCVVTNCKHTYNFLRSEPAVPNVEFQEDE